MRATWTGSIVVGKVVIPATLHKSADHADVAFKSLHRECGSPITQTKSCPSCKVPIGSGYTETMRAVEAGAGHYVEISNAEIEAASGGKQLVLDRFLPSVLVKPAAIDDTFLVAPAKDDSLAARAYDGLLQALAGTGLAGVGRLGFYSKERIAVVWPIDFGRDRLLGLSTVYTVAEMRTDDAAEILERLRGLGGARASEQEVRLFAEALEQRHVPGAFMWRQLARYYPSRVRELVEAKIAGGEDLVASPVVDAIAPRDLVDALRRSIRKAKATKKTSTPA